MKFRSLLVSIFALAILLPAQTPPGFAEISGIRVAVPHGWTFNQALASKGGPIALTNFGGSYLRGGILPPRGAEIEITSVRNPGNVTEFIRNELRSVRDLNLQEASEGKYSGIRVTYREFAATDIDTTTVAFYIPRGPALYKFYLTYRTANTTAGSLQTLLSNEIRGAALR